MNRTSFYQVFYFLYLLTEDREKSAPAHKPRETKKDSSSSPLGASLLDGARRQERSNRPGW